MAAPAAATIAKLVAGAPVRRAAGSGGGSGGEGGGGGLLVLLLVVLLPVGVVVGVVVLLLVLLLSVFGGATDFAQKSCSPAGGGPLPGDFSGPGSLGGVGGTGISEPLVRQVRSGSPYAGSRITPGSYSTTAYGPPWGGIQGPGIATSGGLPIAGGSPRWYMIAVDPGAIAHGTFVYVWPNPFGWKGPFFAADTGGAINGNRIDFYDWRGRATQYRWGTRTAKASAKPIAPSGGGGAPDPPAGGGVPYAPPGGPRGPPSSGTPDNNATAPIEQGPGSPECGGGGAPLAVPGAKGKVVLAPGADRSGAATKQEVLDFLARVAGVAGRRLVVTTGTNHSQYSSSGNVSDHWVGLAADLGSAANGYEISGKGGTLIAAAALRAAGVQEGEAWRVANGGGGHNVCYRGYRIQVIWLTGDHYDHVHVGLRQGCTFEGIQTFQI